MSNVVQLRPKSRAPRKRAIAQPETQLAHWRQAIIELRKFEEQILNLERMLAAKSDSAEEQRAMTELVAARRRIQNQITNCISAADELQYCLVANKCQ